PDALDATAVAQQDIVAATAGQFVVAVGVLGNHQAALAQGEALRGGGVGIGQAAVVANAELEAGLAAARLEGQATGGDVGKIDGLAGRQRLATQQQAAALGQAVDDQLQRLVML